MQMMVNGRPQSYHQHEIKIYIGKKPQRLERYRKKLIINGYNGEDSIADIREHNGTPSVEHITPSLIDNPCDYPQQQIPHRQDHIGNRSYHDTRLTNDLTKDKIKLRSCLLTPNKETIPKQNGTVNRKTSKAPQNPASPIHL